MKRIMILMALIIIAAAMPLTAEPPVSGFFFITAGSGLKIRAGAGLRHRVFFSLPSGEMVSYAGISRPGTIGGRRGYWMQIQWNGREGWAFSRYLTAASGRYGRLLLAPDVLEWLDRFNRRTRRAEIAFNRTEQQRVSGYTSDLKYSGGGIVWEYTRPVVNYVHIHFHGPGMTRNLLKTIQSGKTVRILMLVQQIIKQRRRSADGNYWENHFTARMRVYRIIRQ